MGPGSQERDRKSDGTTLRQGGTPIVCSIPTEAVAVCHFSVMTGFRSPVSRLSYCLKFWCSYVAANIASEAIVVGYVSIMTGFLSFLYDSTPCWRTIHDIPGPVIKL